MANNNEVYLCVIQTDEYKELSFFKSQINEKVNYINLGCEKGINFKTFITIFKLLKRIKPDVVHAHLNTIVYLYLPSINFKVKSILNDDEFFNYHGEKGKEILIKNHNRELILSKYINIFLNK